MSVVYFAPAGGGRSVLGDADGGGAILGGLWGATLVRRIAPRIVRGCVVGFGLVVSALLAYQRWR